MSQKMKVIIGCDGSGFPLKDKIIKALAEDGCYEIKDVGSFKENTGFYIDACEAVCIGVQSGEYDRGILVCGTGQGMNITANKFSGIRSALCIDALTAKMSRADNNANVLCTGTWVIKPEDGVQMARIWLNSDYYDTNIYGLNRVKEFEAKMKQS